MRFSSAIDVDQRAISPGFPARHSSPTIGMRLRRERLLSDKNTPFGEGISKPPEAAVDGVCREKAALPGG